MKKLLIVGCSHAAGYEINGTEDCAYNRQHSFGNQLAKKLGREPVNVAMGALSNGGIVRSVLTWFNEAHDPDDDVVVLVAWTEAVRLDIPQSPCVDYYCPATDHYFDSHRDFLQVNPGIEIHDGMNESEKHRTLAAQRFMAESTEFCEILSLQNIILLQNFFNANNIDYMMCNTMKLYTENAWTDHYIPFIDTHRFMNFHDESQSFYWYYRDAGFDNPLAKHWHHGEEPHRLYSEKLYFYALEQGYLGLAIQ